MPNLTENLRQIHIANEKQKINYIKDWKHSIPDWSQWTPGSHGNPECQTCLGTGWVRPDVPTHHPHFGKLMACPDCTTTAIQKQVEYENTPEYRASL